jgi:hypothetical protein
MSSLAVGCSERSRPPLSSLDTPTVLLPPSAYSEHACLSQIRIGATNCFNADLECLPM